MVRVLGYLKDARVTGWVSLTTLVYFAAEWVVSATWRGYYGYREDLLGPLGVAFCGPQGNWPCSELYRVMNIALVLTGLAIVFVAASLLVQRVTERGHAALLMVAGFGLAASGVITHQVSYTWSLTATTVFTTLGSVSVLFIAMGSKTEMSAERRGVAVIAGIVSLVGYFSYIDGHDFFGAGGAQRMAVYGILAAVIVLGTAGLRSAPVQNAEAPELVEEKR
ncbi:hypothetical protein [Mycolicibacterium hippocampi]|uniref:hypothetical protein n=1 Tax=Mycolicibacterium hippocampi TaxID=659824 RepID=UPI0035152445